MTYDIEYRGYRIRGNARTTYSIWKNDRLVGGGNYMRDAKVWVDMEIADEREREDRKLTELLVRAEDAVLDALDALPKVQP
jgi:hypothetical protein